MSVKSTVYLSREEAEEKYHSLKAQLKPKFSLIDMTDDELEEELEWMNDKVNGGEGYENYVIDVILM